MTVAKMLSTKLKQGLNNLILSNNKSLQILCNNTASMWVSLLLKKDAALALATRPVPKKSGNEKFEVLRIQSSFPQGESQIFNATSRAP